MKTKNLLFLFLFSSFFVTAQSNICQEKEEQLSVFIRDKEFVKANELLVDVKTSCTKHSETLYVLASEVFNYNVEIASKEEKEVTVREYFKFLDLFDKNFPENQNGNFEKRALLLYQNKVGTNDEIFSNLDNAFYKQRNFFNNAEAINLYFKLYFEKYKSQKPTVTIDQLIEKHSEILTLTNENKIKFSLNEKEYNRVISSTSNLIATVITCENLSTYATKNFESKKANSIWLENTANSLSQKCKTAPIFETIALELHKLKPTSKSAYYLGDFYLNTKKQKEAVNYFSQSVELAPAGIEKAKIANTLATILFNSNKSKAKELLLTAISNDSQNGKYYILLANLYVNSIPECASNENEKKAIYQLASTTVLKAGITEPRLKQSSEQISKEYLKEFTIDKSLKRKAIKINCWINETVQF